MFPGQNSAYNNSSLDYHKHLRPGSSPPTQTYEASRKEDDCDNNTHTYGRCGKQRQKMY